MDALTRDRMLRLVGVEVRDSTTQIVSGSLPTVVDAVDAQNEVVTSAELDRDYGAEVGTADFAGGQVIAREDQVLTIQTAAGADTYLLYAAPGPVDAREWADLVDEMASQGTDGVEGPNGLVGWDVDDGFLVGTDPSGDLVVRFTGDTDADQLAQDISAFDGFDLTGAEPDEFAAALRDMADTADAYAAGQNVADAEVPAAYEAAGQALVRHRALQMLGVEVRDVSDTDLDEVSDTEATAVVEAIDLFVKRQDSTRERSLRLAGIELRNWKDQIRDPGGDSGGQWVKTGGIGAKILTALEQWVRGDGSGDPFAGVEREPLRKAAKARGLTIRRGAPREEIAAQLKDHVREQVKAGRQDLAGSLAGQRVRFTLKGPDHRNTDVGVYTEADGKVSLWEVSDNGERHRRIALADDLAGLEAWANQHGESELAGWARGEGGTPAIPTAVKKAAPTQPAPTAPKRLRDVVTGDVVIWEPPGKAPMLGRVTREPGKGVKVDWSGGRREHITTARLPKETDVRVATPEEIDRLGPIRPTIDAPAAPRKAAPTADLTGADGLSDDPAVREVQIENRVRAAYVDAAAQAQGLEGWVGLADLRERLGDLSREEQDAALTKMLFAADYNDPGRVRIIPVANTKALKPRDHAAALHDGVVDNHTIWIGDPALRPLPDSPTKAATPSSTDVSLPAAGPAALAAVPVHISTRALGGSTDDVRGLDALTPRQRSQVTDAVDAYRGLGYKAIGKHLRSGESVRGAKSAVAGIDRAMGESALPKSIVVYRGVATGQSVFGPRADWPDDLTGREWTDASYPSTTASRDIATSGGHVTMRITVPEGTRALKLSDFEQEILLDRGLTFRVVKDHGSDEFVDGFGNRHQVDRLLDVDVVPGNSPGPAAAAKKAAPRKAAAAAPDATLADLRALGSHDEAWAAASKLTVPQLKALLTHMGHSQGLAGQRKGALVDRLAGTWPDMRVDTPTKPAPARKAVPKADGGQGPPVAARAADVARIAQGEPSDRRSLGGGTGATLLTYPDGSRLVTKTQSRRDNDGDELGALVGHALGLQTPATTRNGDQLYMEYMPGTLGARVGAWTFGQDAILDSRDGRLIGLLDLLLVNADRNTGNWIQRDDGGLTAIDHGFAWEVNNIAFAYGSPFARRYFRRDTDLLNPQLADNDMSPADMAVIRRRLEALRPEFDRLGRPDWWQAMMDRMDLVTARAHGTESRLR